MPKTWPACDRCDKAVTIKEGALYIQEPALKERQHQVRDWEREHPGTIWSDEELLARPSRVQWQWGHLRCAEDAMYSIDADRFDTVSKALGWTLHLTGKRWLRDTDWESAIRRFHRVPSP